MVYAPGEPQAIGLPLAPELLVAEAPTVEAAVPDELEALARLVLPLEAAGPLPPVVPAEPVEAAVAAPVVAAGAPVAPAEAEAVAGR
jgi:hypothetical protein